MNSYDGDGVVVADGAAYPCRAKLRGKTERRAIRSFSGTTAVPGHQEWGGDINLLGDEEAAWAVQQAEDLRLRIGDRESGFVTTDGDIAVGTFAIKGNGPIPWN